MAEEKTICTLDYLIGTLATAYKGKITSLVLKDFCVLEKDSSTVFKGTVLSIPEGMYQASLMHAGLELSRDSLKNGYFELIADSAVARKAPQLQIDIVQNGRHIGTFLLKKEKSNDVFVSALELSEEIKDTNFGALTRLLQGKTGLLNKAEEIVSDALSTKQDWKRFSENINSFSKDLFWFDRNAYYRWHKALVRWSVNACKRIEDGASSKAVSNVLSLIELPMEQETDRETLLTAAQDWLDRITESSINLSAGLLHVIRVFSRLLEVSPDLDIKPALTVLTGSLMDLVRKTPVLEEEILRAIKPFVPPEDYALLCNYSSAKRDGLIETLSGASAQLQGDYQKVFEIIQSADSWLLKDRDMFALFSDIVEKNISIDSAGTLTGAFVQLLFIFSTASSDAYKKATGSAVRLAKKLIASGAIDICGTLLSRIEGHGDPLRADMFLHTEVASAILASDDQGLMNLYTSTLNRILIPPPGIRGFSHETWAEITNPLHLERLSKFMEIIALGREAFERTLVRVICNTRISGIFIPDDRIFQRQVTGYLNSAKVGENFLLHYMLLKRLPVYFHEVGATGRLRDDTTEIDSWGNDPVLYFLRKQVHANASNHLIYIIETVMKAWIYGDPEVLAGSVPDDSLRTLDAGLLERYSSAIRPLFESLGILDSLGIHFEKIPEMPEDRIHRVLEGLVESEEIRSKIHLICRIYSELVEKYSLLTKGEGEENVIQSIAGAVSRLRLLKKTIVSPEETLPQETLFFKRHIAFGIPSVMGSYHEPKFDALCEMFMIEEQLRTMLDGTITRIENEGADFSDAGVKGWLSCLSALGDLMQLHGLGNFQIEEAFETLKGNDLCISQVIDVLRICQKELTWMVEFLNTTFYSSVVDILGIFPKEDLPEFLRGLDPGEGNFIHKAADILMRNLMAGITGFFELDRLLNALVASLRLRMNSLSDELLSPSASPRDSREFFTLDGIPDNDAIRLAPLLGNKAKNLVYLLNKGLIVPHGVVFPSSKTRDYEAYTNSDHFLSVLRSAVHGIEERTESVFGGGDKPLFLSVRSGSYVSMPGILDSILYCGMNRDTIAAFIKVTGNPWLAWDSYRRFIEHYGTVVFNLDMQVFEGVTNSYLKTAGRAEKDSHDIEQMKEITRLYQATLSGMGLRIPDDVYEQLRESVKAVFRSWYSERSLQFRKAMGISEHWGTSVALMQMISGNDTDSGASVFFTRIPFSLKKGIYGDTKERATGSDLVYGRSVNRPLARSQALDNQVSLEESDPVLFRKHEELARKIEEAMRGLPQEVEATYTKTRGGDTVIYVLQTRRMEFHRGLRKRFDDVCHMEANVLGRGVGVYGGALSGVATFSSSPEAVRELKRKTNLPVILLRREASTNDVSLMSDIDGIITAAGGATSHAAVLAQKFHLTAIVGCTELLIGRDGNKEFSASLGRSTFREGDPISLDGSTGLVYSGLCIP